MQDIQNKAIKTYLENIEFLKNNHQSLYERVSMLSTAIDNNQYKERYHLEYIKEDQEFDIFDSSNETYLYNRNPKKFIDDAVSNSNLDKVNSIDLLDPEVYNETKAYDVLPNMSIIQRASGQLRNDIFDYIKVFKKSTLYKKKQFKYIDKFIFIGTLLGTHIEKIIKKLNLKFIMIYEYNLEIFRLSLFTTNYSDLNKDSKILFSIMDDTNTVDDQLNHFFNYAIHSNYMMKYYCTNYNINDFFDRLLAIIDKKNPFSFHYMRMVEGLFKPSLENMYKYPILKTQHNIKMLNDSQVLFIAAGPSFDKNIDWLTKNKENFYIVASGAIVIKLFEYSIIPDLIISLDSTEIIINQFPNHLHDKIKKIPFLTSAATYGKILDIFNKENIILYEMMSNYKSSSCYLDGYSIGEISLGLMAKLGAKNIYMLGTDLALNQETGDTHATGNNQLQTKKIDNKDKELNSFVKNGNNYSKDETLLVKGNFRNTVITTFLYNKSIHIYNKIVKSLILEDSTIKIYNLNDGAYIDGTIPLRANDTDIKSNYTKLTNSQVINILKKNSEQGFNSIDKEFVKNSLVVIDSLVKELKSYKDVNIKSYKEFILSRDPILNIIQNKLDKYGSLFIDDFFMNYFLTMERYLGFQFNEDLENEIDLVLEVKKIWITHMLRLANTYKTIVNEYILKD